MFLGTIMNANEFETREIQKLTEIKNQLQHIHYLMSKLYSLLVFAYSLMLPASFCSKRTQYCLEEEIIPFFLYYQDGDKIKFH